MKRSGLVFVISSTLVTACAEKPTLEVVEAQQALAAARDAEADLYAPEQYDLAVSNLQDAVAAIDQQDQQPSWARRYDVPLDLLALSVEQSQAAVEISDRIRLETSGEVERLLPEVQETIDQAFAELQRARNTSVVSRAQIDRLNADLGVSAGFLTDARDNFEKADYSTALDQAQQAIDLADSVRTEARQINQYAAEVESGFGQQAP